MEASCGSCRYWEKLDEPVLPNTGICRRHSPAPVIDEGVGDEESPAGLPEYCLVKWPVVDSVDWCGEWEKRED